MRPRIRRKSASERRRHAQWNDFQVVYNIAWKWLYFGFRQNRAQGIWDKALYFVVEAVGIWAAIKSISECGAMALRKPHKTNLVSLDHTKIVRSILIKTDLFEYFAVQK
jgi:hypothetical protein